MSDVSLSDLKSGTLGRGPAGTYLPGDGITGPRKAASMTTPNVDNAVASEVSTISTAANKGAVDHQPSQTEIAQTHEPAPRANPQNGPSRADLMTAIEALPERIGLHLREVLAPKATPRPPRIKDESKVSTAEADPHVTHAAGPQRGPKNFLEWYTGTRRD